ncbi:putative GTPase/MT1543 [Mycobacterium basiliense]|uniref:Putative GTPase/MT1543 n=1 Tax=Mycobacterium basiliense TaxID=2094119 RepID=A0A447GJF7_9MYCO|nr:GTP-binding protein [Mycobacterium basiliense]VDM90594.1 putative GTPase/MT1543 [Mycobacterium basiliense]
MDIADLIAAARKGSQRAAGRLLSLVEGERRDEVLADVRAVPGHPVRVIGITGPPGAGKSTTIAALVAAYRERECRVAVLAVDPSSPFSGGALLGDRIRMAAHINDSDVLIRSMASRGHLGGLAVAVPAAIGLLGAISYDTVLLETVGVGQSEIEIAALADPTVVILNPGAGDAVQVAKAGLLEVADIVVVNKADRDGAAQTVRDLRAELSPLGAPIVSLVAARGDVGQLVAAIDAHHRSDSHARRLSRARAQILSLAQTRLRSRADLDRLAAEVVAGRDDPYSAAEQLLCPPSQKP